MDVEVGEIYEGKVIKIVEFGCFVELEGFQKRYDGLVHISRMQREGRVERVSDVVSCGDKVKVKVVGTGQRKEINLSLEAVYYNTGDDRRNRDGPDDMDVEVGEIYEGKVIKIVDFGCFVELEGLQKRYDGLVHISRMQREGRVEHVSDVVSCGDKVKVKVVGIGQRKEINLSLEAVYYNTGDDRRNRDGPDDMDVEVGEIYEGKVIKIVDFGCFVELEGLQRRCDGLVHISELQREGRVERVSDVVSCGEKVKVKVLDIMQGKIKLSMKAVDQKTGEDLNPQLSRGLQDNLEGDDANRNPGRPVDMDPEVGEISEGKVDQKSGEDE